MEYQRRRGRRAKYHSLQSLSQPHPRPSYFTSSLISFLIMSSLIGIVYMMLDYHCDSCKGKSDIGNLTVTTAHIAKNLTQLKHSYEDLEVKIVQLSHVLPKVEGQLEIIEALASTIQQTEWSPKSLTQTNIDSKKLTPLEAEDIKNPCSKCTLIPITNKNVTLMY